jgi:hypothetical protein
MGNNGTEADKKEAVVDHAFPAIQTALQSATVAFDAVLKSVGASFKRDTLDARIINDVQHRTGGYIDVQGGYPHGTDYALTVNAWPNLASKTAPQDSDQDGMPDAWEIQQKLDPNNPSDASQIKLHTFYTNIEVYLNTIL